MKVTIVGAGNVGSTCADVIASQSIASEVVLLDIKEGFAEGKALDMMQTSTTLGFGTKIVGTTGDYTLTANSDVVVITSGIPRKPGMTREELIEINAGIVKNVSENILKHSSEAIIIVVSNPMDTMTYLIASLECFNIFSETFLTIPALISINSSLVIPGFLGIPDVITTTSLFAVNV
jgi:malate dehydrogenase